MDDSKRALRGAESVEPVSGLGFRVWELGLRVHDALYLHERALKNKLRNDSDPTSICIICKAWMEMYVYMECPGIEHNAR